MTDATRQPSSPADARTRLLLDGPIIPTLLRIGAPNFVVNVVLIAVTASVDAHFVGRMGGQLGLDGLAGLALVFPLLMVMQQMANMAMGGAIAASIARALGAGRHDEAAALALQAERRRGGWLDRARHPEGRASGPRNRHRPWLATWGIVQAAAFRFFARLR